MLVLRAELFEVSGIEFTDKKLCLVYSIISIMLQRQIGDQRGDGQRSAETDRRSQKESQTVILASSNLKAGAFEEPSNKKRFYPDGVYC